ncbi:MAG: four helix bundle protein, partial [Candidatus Peregrinibacteria bacterium]
TLSISLNIAEAAGRYSDPEMCRFFNIALGSAAEVVACLDHLKADNYLPSEKFTDLFQKILNISKQIQGLQHSAYQKPRIYKKTIS